MKKIITTLFLSLITLIGFTQDLGDWRKGSSATLQATITLDAQAFRNTTLNDSIHV